MNDLPLVGGNAEAIALYYDVPVSPSERLTSSGGNAEAIAMYYDVPVSPSE